MNQTVVEQGLFLLVLVGLAIPLGFYIYKVMTGQKNILSGLLEPVEKKIYQFLGTPTKKEMNVKQYSISVLFLSLFSFLLLTGLMLLGLNP